MRRGIRPTVVVGSTAMVLAIGGEPAGAAPGKCEAPFLIDQVCEAGKTVAGKAGEIATAPVRAAAGGAVDMITNWVADGARWLLGRVMGFIDNSTTIELRAEWFEERYRFMVGIALLVVLPMLLLATIRAIMNQDGSQLARSFFVHLPVAALATFVAIVLTQSLLVITDAMSAAVAEEIAGDVSAIYDGVNETLDGGVGAAASSFALFFGSLFLIIGAFFVWLELLVRSAAVTVSVFFLPVVLAGLVWPAISHWTRRLIETLVALILSKFVIVSVISLASAALSDPGRGGFASIMGAAALMLMAAFSPFALLKLMPLAEGAAVSHLEGAGRRPVETMRPGGSVNHAVSIMRSKVTGSADGAEGSPSGAVARAATVAGASAGSDALPGQQMAATKRSEQVRADPGAVQRTGERDRGEQRRRRVTAPRDRQRKERGDG